MSICADSHGDDICSPWGVNTIGHLDCYLPWTDRADYGDLALGDCDVGCAPCEDYPGDMTQHVAYRYGNRWLRPHPFQPARDASGRLHDLRSGEAWPIPSRVNWERGTCFHNETGEECFGRHVCECWPQPQVVAPDVLSPCPGGDAIGTPITDWFPDALFFSGYTWPRPFAGLYCRHFHSGYAQSVNGTPPCPYGLLMPALLRYSQFTGYSDEQLTGQPTSCGTNMLIACLEEFRQPSAPCWSAYAFEPSHVHTGRRHWVEDAACRNMWHELRLIENTARLDDQRVRFPYQRSGDLEARNAVLSHIRTQEIGGVRFDRLDYVPESAANWRRTFNVHAAGPDCGVLDDPSTLVAVYPDCYLRQAQTPVQAELRILSVDMVVLLVLERLERYEPTDPRSSETIEPHARAKILARCVIRATGEGVRQPDDCQKWPEAIESDDEIVYVDFTGRRFDPPRTVQWLGYHGRLGAHGSNEFPIRLTDQALRLACRDAADGVSGLRIPGWPYLAESNPGMPLGPYVGGLTIGFETTGCA
ncbi:MAG: hypothetical protein JSU86_04445 [Phycisphaerales bacterium]|nr:MAG: hypothetical protein JSU86_04445 [Phycisphaerales bacterium]